MEQVEILLVEDSASDAELTIRALEKHNLLKALHWVRDGQEALDFLYCQGEYESRKGAALPKLVLLDLHMPKINGLEVVAKVKANEGLRNIPIVIISSSDEPHDVKEAYESGVNSYIVKPAEFCNFTAMVVQAGLYWTMANQRLEN